MLAQPPLFAAGLDWLESLLPFLFVLFWVVSQVINVVRAAAGRGKQPPVVVRPQPRGEPRPPANDVRGDLERQIKEFLQQAEGGPRRDDRRRPAEVARDRQPTGPRPARQRPAAPPQPPLPSSARTAAAGETGVARHVQEAFARDLKHRSADLSRDSSQAAEPRPVVPAAATELVAMLRNPATLRQLVLLREVLDRPTERW